MVLGGAGGRSAGERILGLQDQVLGFGTFKYSSVSLLGDVVFIITGEFDMPGTESSSFHDSRFLIFGFLLLFYLDISVPRNKNLQ